MRLLFVPMLFAGCLYLGSGADALTPDICGTTFENRHGRNADEMDFSCSWKIPQPSELRQ